MKGDPVRDFVTLGTTPYDEPCACMGEPDYHVTALSECLRFILLLRETFGVEPEGAWLSVKSFPHDFGIYQEVVCYFNTDIPESMDDAFRCENERPATWKG